ncbi:MAG: ribonuclease M5 [Erysipelotrichaceae bacterium]|nr:ribonuclease M5 [Erysipelotrichaceae bacterium]MDY5253010.1 ribonuclease M5 [Erysipelotrichaceae bacterium]
MIKEIIVVEGKNDTLNLKRYFDCDTIETHGTCLSDFTLGLIAKAQKRRGVIIFCDPDSPGEKIRSIINEKVKGCKNAFLQADDCRFKHKVGIEHASYEILKEALENLLTYGEYETTLTTMDLLELGLSGQSESASLRNKVGRKLHIGKCNTKQLLKRCNMLQLNKEDIRKVLTDEDNC